SPGLAPGETAAPSGSPRGAPQGTQATEPLLALAGGGDDPGLSGLAEFPLDQSTVRGAEAPESTRGFTVARTPPAIRLSHPEAALLAEGDVRPVNITVTTPSGLRLECWARIGDLRQDRPLVLRFPQGTEVGVYRYVYVFGGRDAEAPIRGELRLAL